MPHDYAALWVDRSLLQGVQYRTDANLAARQALYAHQRPRIDLARSVIGLAGLRDGETIADIGCGNGHYLAELARHSQAGPGAVFRVRTRSGCLVAS